MRRPRVDEHGVILPRLTGGERRVPWRDIQAVADSRGAPVLGYRDADSGRPHQRSLAGMPAAERDALHTGWSDHLRSRLAEEDRLDGELIGRDATPTWLLIVLTVVLGAAVTASVVAFARTVAELWPFVGDLPGDARGWFLLTLTLYLIAGLGLVGVLLAILRQHLVRRGQERRFGSWRIDRDGFARRLGDGSWQALGPAAGDRLDQAAAVLAGERLPLDRLSGGKLARELLYGLALQRGATVAFRPLQRATVLRLLLLWPPLLVVGGWLVARFLELEDATPLLYGVLLGLVIALPVAAALWWADRTAERRFQELLDRAERVVDELGW